MMYRHFTFIGAALLIAVLQTTVEAMILPGWMQPDMLLATVVLLGLFLQSPSGSAYAFGIGYLMDLLTGCVTGTYAFERILIFLAAYWLNGQFYAKSPLVQGLMVLVLAIVDYILIWVLTSVFGTEGVGLHLWEMVPRSIFSGIVGFALYYPLSIVWEGGQREF